MFVGREEQLKQLSALWRTPLIVVLCGSVSSWIDANILKEQRVRWTDCFEFGCAGIVDARIIAVDELMGLGMEQ